MGSKQTPEYNFFLSLPRWTVLITAGLAEAILIIITAVGILPMIAFIGITIVLVAIVALLFVVLKSGAGYIKKQDETVEENTDWRKQAQIQIAIIKTDVGSSDILREVEDMIRYADPVSNEETEPIESRMLMLLKNADESNADNAFTEIKKLMMQRDAICRLYE